MSKEVIRSEEFCNINSGKLLENHELTVSEEQAKELASIYEGLFDNFKPGKIITGKIVSIDSDGVYVDVGFKSFGFIPKIEFGVYELKDLVVGQPLDVMLDTLENAYGGVVLSYEKAKVMRAWDVIVKLYEENKPVEGIITHKVKGGLNVDIGIPAFLPGSQIDIHRVADFDQYVGQKITACILKINRKRGNIIISRRKYLSDQRVDVRKKVLETLQEGQVIRGFVKNITNYGVFVDIGGVDGLLHITDMAWGRISHPSEIVKIGDEITVKVLSFDRVNEKISLDLKHMTENPWKKIADTYKVGSKIKGRVSSITDYGLFVEVEKGVEGLVHISEISWFDRIANPADRFKVGDEIEVLLVALDLEHHRMSLSIKQLQGNPWETVDKQFTVGQRIKGSISNITDFGIFVRLLPGVDGLVHISDLSWTEHVNHPSDRYKQGQEVEAIVLAIDKDNRKISLGIKQLDRDPWENVETEYPLGTIIEGTISKVANFGAFVRLASGIEGLLHNTVLLDEQGKRADELFKPGQTGKFRVVNVSKKDHRLGLSPNLEARPRTTKRGEAAAEPRAPETRHYRETMPPLPTAKPKGALQVALESAIEKRSKDEAEAEKVENSDDSASVGTTGTTEKTEGQ